MNAFAEFWHRLGLVGRVGLSVVVLALVGLPIAQCSYRPTSSTTAAPVGGTVTMPDYRGQLVGNVAADIRRALGQQVSVSAPGGQSAVNLAVTATSPAPGSQVSASTQFLLYTAPGGVATSAPAAAAAASSGTFGQGTYVVGSDIQPGTYRTTGATAQGLTLCQWFRLKDTTGDTGAFLASGNADGPAVVTVKATDGAVEFQGGCVWTKS